MEKEAQLSRQLEKDLFGDDEVIDEEDGTAANLHRQKKMLHEGRKNLNQGMEHATNISSELERQKEKLQKSIHTVDLPKKDQRDNWGFGHVCLSYRLDFEHQEEEQAHLLCRGLWRRLHLCDLAHKEVPVLVPVDNSITSKIKNMVLMRLELMTLELLAPRSNLLS
jgi:hypothetical protein